MLTRALQESLYRYGRLVEITHILRTGFTCHHIPVDGAEKETILSSLLLSPSSRLASGLESGAFVLFECTLEYLM